MFGMIGKVICAVLSVLCFGYSGVCLFSNTDAKAAAVVEAKDYNIHPENEGKMVMMRGKLTYNGTIVEDPDLGVRVKTPILQRHTVMFQYIPSHTDEKLRTAQKGWDSKSHPSFTDKTGRRFNNPYFPSDIPKDKLFACDLTMENGNLKIDADFIRALSFGKYVYFKDTYNSYMVNVTNLYTKKLPEHFVNLGNSFYRYHQAKDNSIFDKISIGKRDSRVGDIRISYKAFKWNDNLPEFTIIGKQENGKLLSKEGSFFFDYRINDLSELQKEMRSNNRYAMFGALGCGVILAALALFI